MTAINKNLALIVALVAWFFSYNVAGFFTEKTEGYYVVLMFVDIFFVFVVAWSPIKNIQKRYMSVILAIVASVSGFASINQMYYVSFDETAMVFPVISYFALFFDDNYTPFGLIMSILMCVVTITPKGLLNAIDSRVWPASLDFIYYTYAEDGLAGGEKGAWDSRRGAGK